MGHIAQDGFPDEQWNFLDAFWEANYDLFA
jgi:hypothetical protein